MTREKLLAIAKKHFGGALSDSNELDLLNISPIDMLEFICEIEQIEQKVIPTEKIRQNNFKNLDSIYKLISE